MHARTRWAIMVLALLVCVAGGCLFARCQAAPVAPAISKAGDLATRMNLRSGDAVFDSAVAGGAHWFSGVQVTQVDYWTAGGDPVAYATLSEPGGDGCVIRLTQQAQVDMATTAMVTRQRLTVVACRLVKQPRNPINGFFNGDVYLPVLIMFQWHRDPEALK